MVFGTADCNLFDTWEYVKASTGLANAVVSAIDALHPRPSHSMVVVARPRCYRFAFVALLKKTLRTQNRRVEVGLLEGSRASRLSFQFSISKSMDS